MREVNKHDGGQKVYNFMVDIDNIFGILSLKEESIPKEVQKLSAEREKARSTKDFKKADELRTQVKKLGYTIEDTDEGPRLKKL